MLHVYRCARAADPRIDAPEYRQCAVANAVAERRCQSRMRLVGRFTARLRHKQRTRHRSTGGSHGECDRSLGGAATPKSRPTAGLRLRS